jgi:hypothetical protein
VKIIAAWAGWLRWLCWVRSGLPAVPGFDDRLGVVALAELGTGDRGTTVDRPQRRPIGGLGLSTVVHRIYLPRLAEPVTQPRETRNSVVVCGARCWRGSLKIIQIYIEKMMCAHDRVNWLAGTRRGLVGW